MMIWTRGGTQHAHITLVRCHFTRVNSRICHVIYNYSLNGNAKQALETKIRFKLQLGHMFGHVKLA